MHTTDELQSLVEQELKRQEITREPRELYEPIDYTLSTGGKRIRPLLLLMAADLYSDDIQQALMPALGIEVFHNFTLLHDDLMDRASLRRNKPTVHEKWDPNTAILSGDAMLIKAYEFMLEYRGANLPRVLGIFSQTALKVCEGQQYDMNFEQAEDVPEDDYLKMIGLKTGALIAGSLQMGAIIGGATEDEALLLHDFGWKLGIAFQLQDDYLDTFGDPEVFGKKIGGDILADKKTFLVIKAMENAGSDQKRELKRLMGNRPIDPGEKIQEVKKIFRRIGVGDLTHIKAEQYYGEALQALEKIAKSRSQKTHLRDLADNLMRRHK